MVIKNTRRTERTKAAQSVSIAWDDLQGQHKFAFVHCIDLSEEGLALHLAEPLQIGSYVSLKSNQLHLAGRAQVKNCTRRNHLYRVGLEFSPEMRSARKPRATVSSVN